MNQNDVEKLILLFDGNKLPYSKLHKLCLVFPMTMFFR